MNWQPLPETRCKYILVRSDAASMRHTVTGNGYQYTPLIVSRTAVSIDKYSLSFGFETVGSMDATVKPTGMYLRRVERVNDGE